MFRSLGRKILQGIYFAFDVELSYLSWGFLTRFGKRLPSYGDSYALVGAKEYSREALKKHRPQLRTRVVLQLLASLPHQVHGNLLILGPRYESEIFLARGLGWNKKSIFALDLLSYSKRIVLGDIHSAPFENEKFKSIAAPWVISYSHNPRMFADELNRMLEPDGVLIFGVDFVDQSTKEILEVPQESDRVQTRSQFQDLFPNFKVILESDRHNLSNWYIIMLKKTKDSKGVA